MTDEAPPPDALPGEIEIAVVGGGPAGALTAGLLAGLGHEVAVLERSPTWRWRACGVFTSPASVERLRDLGISEAELARLATPVEAMAVQTQRGTRFPLTYGGTGVLADSAVGFDRAALDPFLRERARAAGASVHQGAAADRVDLSDSSPRLRLVGGRTLRARWVIGADGLRSVVARDAGVRRRPPLGPRAALTFHTADPGLAGTARMVLLDGAYVGLAPVPGGRCNVGIVLGRRHLEGLRRDGGPATAERFLDEALKRTLGADASDRASPARLSPLDHVAGVAPLGHAVTRRSGPGWLLVGDAAGFLDPFTGEGIHRAIRSAELASETIHAGAGHVAYDRAMRAEFGTKDLVSRLVLEFLTRPALFEHAARRLARRSGVRETMGLVMGDLVPASRALDPRFLVALLRP